MNHKQYNMVCFGEILWDNLPNGTMPGGAPMNVAYHLKKLGNEPALITKVGSDEWGNKLKTLMENNSITTDFFQTDDTLQTGKVNATIGNYNEVTYDILEPVAWDNIEWQDELADLVANSKYFVFGSLATRSHVNEITLAKLLGAAKFRVLDINLRAPHYTKDKIEHLLHHVDLLKLNQSELELLGEWFTEYKSDADCISALQDRFDIPDIVVTKAGDGAIFNCNGQYYSHPGHKIVVADTVGSGDAFLAALLTKLSVGGAAEDALEFACGVGALVASYRGGCPDYSLHEIQQLSKAI